MFIFTSFKGKHAFLKSIAVIAIIFIGYSVYNSSTGKTSSSESSHAKKDSTTYDEVYMSEQSNNNQYEIMIKGNHVIQRNLFVGTENGTYTVDNSGTIDDDGKVVMNGFESSLKKTSDGGVDLSTSSDTDYDGKPDTPVTYHLYNAYDNGTGAELLNSWNETVDSTK